jgi:hypothetical protein
MSMVDVTQLLDAAAAGNPKAAAELLPLVYEELRKLAAARSVLATFLIGDVPPPTGFDGIDLNDNTARLVAADAYQEAGRERDVRLLRDLTRRVTLVGGCVVDPTAAVFSPWEAREERFRRMRLKRQTKVQPSQKSRRAVNPKRTPGAAFTTTGYAHAVAKAAKGAGVPHWHPNQLRHLFATEVRKAHGLEAAQVLLSTSPGMRRMFHAPHLPH